MYVAGANVGCMLFWAWHTGCVMAVLSLSTNVPPLHQELPFKRTDVPTALHPQCAAPVMVALAVTPAMLVPSRWVATPLWQRPRASRALATSLRRTHAPKTRACAQVDWHGWVHGSRVALAEAENVNKATDTVSGIRCAQAIGHNEKFQKMPLVS